MRNRIFSLILAASVMNGCTIDMSGDDESESTDSIKVVTPTASIQGSAARHIDQLLHSYFALKNALVKSDSAEAQRQAASFGSTAASTDSGLIVGAQQAAFAKHKAALILHIGNVRNATNLNRQREAFSPLSASMYELIKYFGSSKPVYREYCPMALNDQGAMWLSGEEEIRNPYFGDEMLECGTVEEVIQR